MPSNIDKVLDAGKYPVMCGGGFLADGDAWARYAGEGRVAPVSNRAVWDLYGDSVMQALGERACEPVLMGDGEEFKSWRSVEAILDGLADRGLRRDGGVAALGGGVVGDAAGFAAAVYMRGIRVVHAPTTLLAQVDSAIGGKTGVNLASGKNMAGSFHAPSAVLCDVETLVSLPDRHFRAGLAEVVKYGMLGDAEFFGYLEEHADALLARDEAALRHVVAHCAGMKIRITSADERETGDTRALLNLGHTFAHALEHAAGYGAWLHGEAVAAGLAAAARLSESLCGFPEADSERVVSLLSRLHLPVSLHGEDPGAIADAMQRDKKHGEGGMRFVVMEALGRATVRPLSSLTPAQAALDRIG